MIAGQNNVYQALQREKDLERYIEQDFNENFNGVYRSKPVTYFEEKEIQPLTLDEVLNEFDQEKSIL